MNFVEGELLLSSTIRKEQPEYMKLSEVSRIGLKPVHYV